MFFSSKKILECFQFIFFVFLLYKILRMKTLILIRHAKSDWPENVDDFDRPLTELGKHNAPKMAHVLKNKIDNIDAFITSPAKRALETCRLFADIYNKDYTIENTLYNPREVHFENIIYGLDMSINTIAMFSHNNGISNFANTLTNEIINLPTCGIAAYNIDCEDWTNFEKNKKSFLYFLSPKHH